MTGDAPAWLLAVLIAASGLLLAVLRWDLQRVPRLLASRRVIAAAEQVCWDADFHTITEPLEQP